MKRDFLIKSVVLASLLFFTGSHAHAYTFLRNLKVGDQGSDVLELQKILNASPDTMISLSGTGSVGQETTYFGLLTQQAVIKYQNKYKNEVLTPSGLVYGTGFVGDATRKKLNNSLISSPSTTPIVPKITYTNQIPTPSLPKLPSLNTNIPISTKLQLFAVSEVRTVAGRTITAKGIGFTAANNTIAIGNSITIPSLPSTNFGSEILFTIPSTISPGEYKVTVTNANGTTKKAPFLPTLIIGSSIVTKPTITSITPIEAKMGDTITIKGTGFTKDNRIVTTLGKITNVSSSDSKTITFKISKLPYINQLTPNSIRKVGVSVSNENGGVVVPATFVLKYE